MQGARLRFLALHIRNGTLVVAADVIGGLLVLVGVARKLVANVSRDRNGLYGGCDVDGYVFIRIVKM